jgi:hypothetical protein
MSIRFFVLQDSADFYLYNDESCTDLHNTLTFPTRVGFDLTRALKARQWFESVMREAGFKYTWANPFRAEPASSPRESHAPQPYTGLPASPVTRMVDMSAYRGDDLEF